MILKVFRTPASTWSARVQLNRLLILLKVINELVSSNLQGWYCHLVEMLMPTNFRIYVYL